MVPFTPNDWFWLADDGRLFSSKTGKVTTVDDPAFVAWSGPHRPATQWPRDGSGNQTTASLNEMLSPLGIELRQ